MGRAFHGIACNNSLSLVRGTIVQLIKKKKKNPSGWPIPLHNNSDHGILFRTKALVSLIINCLAKIKSILNSIISHVFPHVIVL